MVARTAVPQVAVPAVVPHRVAAVGPWTARHRSAVMLRAQVVIALVAGPGVRGPVPVAGTVLPPQIQAVEATAAPGRSKAVAATWLANVAGPLVGTGRLNPQVAGPGDVALTVS